MTSDHPARVAVLVSGRGSNFEALHHALQSAPEISAQIVGLISDQPQALALEKAQRLGVPAKIVDATAHESKAAFEHALMVALSALAPDWIVLAGFMRVLTADAIKPFAGRMINIHPSLLPRHRGLHTHERVLAAGERQHGASMHFVTPELDGGPVLSQVAMAVDQSDDATSLAQRLLPLEHRLMKATVALLATHDVKCANGKITINGQALLQPLQLGHGPDHGLDDRGRRLGQPSAR